MNTKGIGAKAWLFAGGKTQYQQLMLTRGFMSSSEEKLHFGLDSANRIDSLLIVWPDQRYQLLRGLEANRSIVAPGSKLDWSSGWVMTGLTGVPTVCSLAIPSQERTPG